MTQSFGGAVDKIKLLREGHRGNYGQGSKKDRQRDTAVHPHI